MATHEEKRLIERVAKLQQKVEDHEQLLRAVIQLNMDFNLEKVLVNILQQMAKITSAEAGSLWLVNKPSMSISARAAIGSNAEEVKNVRLFWGEGIVGSVIQNGKGELVADVSKDPRWASRVDKESGFVTHSILTIPLVSKTNPIGAIQLINKVGQPSFEERDYQLAVSLAFHSAIAIRNSQVYEDLQSHSQRLVETLMGAIESREPQPQGHATRVSRLARWTGEMLAIGGERLNMLECAALLHDIGKLGVRDTVVGKQGEYTEEEYQEMKRHVYHVLQSGQMKDDWFTEISHTCLHHHERVDGTGYPDGLKGDEIPLFARVVAVAEAFDDLTRGRSYRGAITAIDAVKELIRSVGSRYDRQVVDAFVRALHEKGELRRV